MLLVVFNGPDTFISDEGICFGWSMRMISSVILGSSVVDFVSPITIFSLSFRSFLSVKVIIITMIVFGKSFSHFLLGSQIYIFFNYYVCLPQLVWNSSTCRKHIPGKPGLVCAQARPNWVAAGLVPTPLSRKLGPSAVGSSPTLYKHYCMLIEI